jgi:Cu-Zn family superoxide dismutase
VQWKGKVSLTGAESIIGKSVVVHEKADDLKTDPSGNSGARIACGVIEAAK